MLAFPNCKINLGLHVTTKRTDGYHDLETVFYPVMWQDALEFVENKGGSGVNLTTSGLPIDSSPGQNLIEKVYQLLQAKLDLPPLNVHLHKNIPMGAGLGGGSADAAFFIKMLAETYNRDITEDQLISWCTAIGSDCAFFIRNRPVYATGRGEQMEDLSLDLSDHYILVVHPGIHSNTAEAFSGLKPAKRDVDLRKVLTSTPISDWKQLVKNDFETTLFAKYPAIGQLKENMYANGALYASMSGSGSAVFGIFSQLPGQEWLPKNSAVFLQKPLRR